MADTDTVQAPVRSLAAWRSPALVAGYVAAILGAIQLVRLLFSGLPWAVIVGSQQAAREVTRQSGNLYDVVQYGPTDYVALAGGEFVSSLLLTVVPFAVGVFVSLWLVLPVSAGVRFRSLVLRGLVASLLGAAVATLVYVVRVVPAGGYMPPDQWALQFLEAVALAASYAPVVLLVLVVRAYVPRSVRT